MRKATSTALLRLSIFCLVFWSFCNQRLQFFVDSLSILQPVNKNYPPQSSSTSSTTSSRKSRIQQQQRVAIVGAGISGLTIAHVLQQSGCYKQVQVLEAKPHVGGHVRSMKDPLMELEEAAENEPDSGDSKTRRIIMWLNIGHATHMGMFINLRLMLRHFGLSEWPVGRGPNHQPGLFRMTSVTASESGGHGNGNHVGGGGGGGGQTFQPPLQDILSWSSWWQAFVFYFDSYIDPTQRLDAYLNQKKEFFSPSFLNIIYWAMATFEFDKERTPEMGEYALGTARALLITQVFFRFLLCERFEGRLPGMIDSGLKDDLAKRIVERTSIMASSTTTVASKTTNVPLSRGDPRAWQQAVSKCFQDMTANVPLASYFTADYGSLMDKLAAGAGSVLTNTTVMRVMMSKQQNKNDKLHDEEERDNDDILLLETSNGKQIEADAIVFTTHPHMIKEVLNPNDFPQHLEALQGMDSGAVGVRIVHAKSLPFPYPPAPPQDNDNEGGTWSASAEEKSPPPILGIFDISELTTIAIMANGVEQQSQQRQHQSQPPKEAGWLSIAYPIYRNTTRNRHQQFLDTIPTSSSSSPSCLDETIYPWTRATPSFIQAQRKIVELQGTNGIYITGQALTGVNKASELQVTNALNLCHDYFNACPPWKYFISCPMLPDCNDVDAFRQASSPWQALGLAIKSLIGSFVLTTLMTRLGVEFFEGDHSTSSTSRSNG